MSLGSKRKNYREEEKKFKLINPQLSARFRLGTNLRIAIVHARWNSRIVNSLIEGAKKTLAEAGVKDENVVMQRVPGSYELPLAVQR